MHDAADVANFSQKESPAQFGKLDDLAKRIRQSLLKCSCLLFLCLLMLPQENMASEWSTAEEAFERALQAPAGSPEADAYYQESALLFEAAAETKDAPALAWYNAGNAWFQSGSMGHAIAAYLHAAQSRPFDHELQENLSAARALALNSVPDDRNVWERLPTAWIQMATIVLNLVFWFTLLFALRHRSRNWKIATAITATILIVLAVNLLLRQLNAHTHGVVVVDAVEARKGPAYAYAPAFDQALHDGLEFKLIKQENSWSHIALLDGRKCWIPAQQTKLIQP